MLRLPSLLASLFTAALLLAVFASSPLLAAEQTKASAKEIAFFEKKIRPVLVKHCYECHSEESEEDDLGGGLLLDTREGIRKGGDSGHAVVPGNVKKSLLLSALLYEDLEMPPEEPLPANVIADFRRWIRKGAADPRRATAPLRPMVDLEKARQFWSFQPIRRPQPPSVKDNAWPKTEIDRFVLARLEAKALHPLADAEPAVLVRRLYFDLIGLPPAPEQVEAFVGNPTPRAYQQLITQLLDSPQFGERWGRHWLDVVRYGESTGMERNFTYPHAWRYRDYVIQAFNDDKPFDRFIQEQVAGDLLPAKNDAQRAEQLIATGLLAMGPKSLNENNREKFAMDVVDEQIDVTTQAFMGVTASCARCHNHKFDPIPQSEYYALAGIFRSTDTLFGTAKVRGNRQAGQLLALDDGGLERVSVAGGKQNKAQIAKISRQLKSAQRRVAQFRRQVKKKPALKGKLAKLESQVRQLQKRLKKTQPPKKRRKKNQPNVAVAPAKKYEFLVMAVQDAEQPRDTALRIRGEANQRGDVIPRGFLSVLTRHPTPKISARESGRLQYAQWLTADDNPLTARVAVNRTWQHLFGRGMVSTVNNFGATGERPTHPELLDHLASQFVEEGWSLKSLIRRIVSSHVYQLGGGSNVHAEEVDPDNNLLWKMNQRRLEAEAIRDAILQTAGQLDLTPGKGSVVETIGDGDVGRNIRTDRFVVASRQRSVYLPIVRGALPEMLQVFDFPDPSIIFGQREVTTVPTQALFMLNNAFVLEQAAHFAQRISADEKLDADQRIGLAYRLALSRRPTSEELSAAKQYLQNASQKNKPISKPAWSRFCQALLASADFRYLD